MTHKDSDLLTDCLIATMQRTVSQRADGEQASSDAVDSLVASLAAAISRAIGYMSPDLPPKRVAGEYWWFAGRLLLALVSQSELAAGDEAEH
jgi:hypothetical protein